MDLHSGPTLTGVCTTLQPETASRAAPIRSVVPHAAAFSYHHAAQPFLCIVVFPTVLPFRSAAAPRCLCPSDNTLPQICQICTARLCCPLTLYSNLFSMVTRLTNSITDWGWSGWVIGAPQTNRVTNVFQEPDITLFPNLSSNYNWLFGIVYSKFSKWEIKWAKLFSWSQSANMFLKGCNQFGFLTGEIVCPPLGDTLEQLWKGEDSIIRSMLINSIEP